MVIIILGKIIDIFNHFVLLATFYSWTTSHKYSVLSVSSTWETYLRSSFNCQVAFIDINFEYYSKNINSGKIHYIYQYKLRKN